MLVSRGLSQRWCQASPYVNLCLCDTASSTAAGPACFAYHSTCPHVSLLRPNTFSSELGPARPCSVLHLSQCCLVQGLED